MSENNMQDSTDKKIDLTRVSPERQAEIQKIFEMLGLNNQRPYQGADDFSRQLQKTSKLQYEGVIFTTSSSSLSPFKQS